MDPYASTILIVDDETSLHLILAQMLGDTGYTTFKAHIDDGTLAALGAMPSS